MKNYQVWLRGSELCDVKADNESEARERIRKIYGFKRLPKGTVVVEIPPGYYDKIVKSNREIGISSWND